MGWSHSADAGKTLDKWTEACVALTGSSNVYTDNGQRYMIETSRVEHEDGAITGSVYRFVGETSCVKTGGFKIDGEGRVVRAPAFLRGVAAGKPLDDPAAAKRLHAKRDAERHNALDFWREQALHAAQPAIPSGGWDAMLNALRDADMITLQEHQKAFTRLRSLLF